MAIAYIKATPTGGEFYGVMTCNQPRWVWPFVVQSSMSVIIPLWLALCDSFPASSFHIVVFFAVFVCLFVCLIYLFVFLPITTILYWTLCTDSPRSIACNITAIYFTTVIHAS